MGFLGEQEQKGWWSSLWLTGNASAFLAPIYGSRLNAARYHGVVEAAQRIHDERIGIGRAFHLFRLPEGLERRLHDTVVRDNVCEDLPDITEISTAEATLVELAPDTKEVKAGPVKAGEVNDLKGNKWVGTLAAHYRAAFESSNQTFPYFVEQQ